MGFLPSEGGNPSPFPPPLPMWGHCSTLGFPVSQKNVFPISASTPPTAPPWFRTSSARRSSRSSWRRTRRTCSTADLNHRDDNTTFPTKRKKVFKNCDLNLLFSHLVFAEKKCKGNKSQGGFSSSSLQVANSSLRPRVQEVVSRQHAPEIFLKNYLWEFPQSHVIF